MSTLYGWAKEIDESLLMEDLEKCKLGEGLKGFTDKKFQENERTSKPSTNTNQERQSDLFRTI